MASATWFSFPGGSFFLRCNNVDAWKISLGTSVINLELLLEQNNVRLLYVSWECNEHWGLYCLYGNGTHYVNHSFSVNQSGENWSKKVIIHSSLSESAQYQILLILGIMFSDSMVFHQMYLSCFAPSAWSPWYNRWCVYSFMLRGLTS